MLPATAVLTILTILTANSAPPFLGDEGCGLDVRVPFRFEEVDVCVSEFLSFHCDALQ